MSKVCYYFLDPSAEPDYTTALQEFEAQQKAVYPTGNKMGERRANDNSEHMVKVDMTGSATEETLRAIANNNAVIAMYEQSQYREVLARLDDPKWQPPEQKTRREDATR